MRVSIFDVSAAVLVGIVILLPAPTKPIYPVYARAALGPEVAAAQADVARDSTDTRAVERLAGLLSRAGQSDWALRVAGEAAQDARAGDAWRRFVLVSTLHAERFDVARAHEWAVKALAACEASAATCAEFEQGRLSMYATALKAGLDSGVDPRVDPDAFESAIQKAIPTIHVKKPGS